MSGTRNLRNSTKKWSSPGYKHFKAVTLLVCCCFVFSVKKLLTSDTCICSHSFDLTPLTGWLKLSL